MKTTIYFVVSHDDDGNELRIHCVSSSVGAPQSYAWVQRYFGCKVTLERAEVDVPTGCDVLDIPTEDPLQKVLAVAQGWTSREREASGVVVCHLPALPHGRGGGGFPSEQKANELAN